MDSRFTFPVLPRLPGNTRLSPGSGATSPTQFSLVDQRLFAVLPPSQVDSAAYRYRLPAESRTPSQIVSELNNVLSGNSLNNRSK